VSLVTTPLPEPAATPIVISGESDLSGLRPGESLVAESGSQLVDLFHVIGGTMSVRGGEIGDALEAYQASIVVESGKIGDGAFLFDSELALSGGSIGDGFFYEGSVVTMSGGMLGSLAVVLIDSTLALSGGSMADFLVAEGESQVNLIGHSFLLGGKRSRALSRESHSLSMTSSGRL
jgi:hypothetical protein